MHKCLVCCREDDGAQEDNPEMELGANMSSLSEYQEKYRSGWRPALLSEENEMHKQLMTLSDGQLAFIFNECHLSKEELLAMNDDALYDNVYDRMCDIETEETPADDSEESEHCRMASDIVTILGNALAIND